MSGEGWAESISDATAPLMPGLWHHTLSGTLSFPSGKRMENSMEKLAGPASSLCPLAWGACSLSPGASHHTRAL